MNPPERYQFGPFLVDPTERECRRGAGPIPLAGKAFDLLLVLLRNPGRTIPKAELMTALWGDTAVEESNLTQTVFLLRKALGDDSERTIYIQTAPRIGYKFVAPVTVPAEAARRQSRRWMWPAFAAALLIVAVLVGFRRVPGANAHTLKPFSFEAGLNSYPVWSPDGKAVVFANRARESANMQLFVRFLDSSAPMQLTHGQDDAVPLAWTTQGRIVFRSVQPPSGLWSISLAGGEAEPLLGLDEQAQVTAHVFPDGSAAAFYGVDKDGAYRVFLSVPLGSPPREYAPAVPPARNRISVPQVRFSPDGKQILLVRSVVQSEVWLMPYPPSASNPPRRILPDLPPHKFTPTVSWMPDNRRIVLALGPDLTQLYLADTVSGELSVLSKGTNSQVRPAVSPDGHALIFQDVGEDHDLVSMDLADAAVRPFLASNRSEDLPAWALRAPSLAYITDRSGHPEIWLHKPGENDRLLVTSEDFPGGAVGAFMNPVLSPDGSRIAYRQVGGTGATWMSLVAGGPPVRFLESTQTGQPGSWSPDGEWLTLLTFPGNETADLHKVKTTGQARPQLVKTGLKRSGSGIMPDWSPTGEWILNDDGGPRLISPDGKRERAIGSGRVLACGFSRDGLLVYCMRQEKPNVPGVLFSVPVAGGPEKVIGTFAPEHRPQPGFAPSLRLTPTPDGKSLTYSIRKLTSNLWMLGGIQ